MHFADRLDQRITETASRIVIGIDPDPVRLFASGSRLKTAFPGKSNEHLLETFCSIIIEVAKTYACAIKPQAAFFESMGISGLKALSQCILQARKMHIPVILDAKRGDIGNTASAYAKAYLDPSSEFFADALTVNPYLGPDTLEPFVQMANRNHCGLFILVKTSNPGSGAFQDLKIHKGNVGLSGTLAARVAETVRDMGSSTIGNCGFSNIGAVVGATYPEDLEALRSIMPYTLFLLPGYGAQGGTAQDVKPAFCPGGKGALVSSSRGIIFAYEALARNGLSQADIFEAIANAAQKAREDINSPALAR
ncbi:MAG: orotidine-5'-phosphate decarboxylase [Bacillota bacterium]